MRRRSPRRAFQEFAGEDTRHYTIRSSLNFSTTQHLNESVTKVSAFQYQLSVFSFQFSALDFPVNSFFLVSIFRVSVFRFQLSARPVDLNSRGRNFENHMINVTDNAVRQLRVLLKEKVEAAHKGLRVQIVKGGCSGLNYEMALDDKKSGDAVVERDGVEFYIDNESASYLRGATLDFRDGLTAVGFQIVNPNAARTCGCGSSFEATKPA